MSVTVRTDPVQTLEKFLLAKADEFGRAIPRQLARSLTPDRMIRLALTACRKNPQLADCTQVSLIACLMQACQLGLELDDVLGHAYLVPYRNGKTRRLEAQLIIGYKGFRSLAFRSGQVKAFPAHCVHAGDHFKFCHGSKPYLDFAPALKGRGEPIAVYASVSLANGGFDFEVLGWEEVLACQARYGTLPDGRKKNSPWWTHVEAMGCKTAVRRLAKRVPLTADLGRAANLDELAEEGLPQGLPFDPKWLGQDAVNAEGRVTQQQLQELQLLSQILQPDEFQALVEQYGAERPEELMAERAEELISHLEDLGGKSETMEEPQS
jgi:recombination protein RecT